MSMTTGGVDIAALSRANSSLALAQAAALKAQATGSRAAAGGQATATTASSTITGNDFLTLLVTELQNQDPTQPTDPSAYIQQLVGVNSLEQLIAINQDLTPAAATTTGSAGNGITPVSTQPSAAL